MSFRAKARALTYTMHPDVRKLLRVALWPPPGDRVTRVYAMLGGVVVEPREQVGDVIAAAAATMTDEELAATVMHAMDSSGASAVVAVSYPRMVQGQSAQVWVTIGIAARDGVVVVPLRATAES